MAELRLDLQEAIGALMSAETAEQRRQAAAAATRAVAAFAEQPAREPPSPDAVVAAQGDLLRETGAVLRALPDADLDLFNRLLPWGAVSTDERGRLIGAAWSAGKRNSVARPVDPRQAAFDRALPLKGRRVLEVGCFEGLHTIGLTLLGAEVVAADARIENVLKTLARLWAYGRRAEVVLWDVEGVAPETAPREWDVLHHIGVLYHLADPVRHLDALLPRTRTGVLLDTHVARGDESLMQRYPEGEGGARYVRVGERVSSPFAGMYDHARWLALEDLLAQLDRSGFRDVRVVSDRDERNGRRVTVWAFR